jgi:hypothetical protein
MIDDILNNRKREARNLTRLSKFGIYINLPLGLGSFVQSSSPDWTKI